MAGRAVIYIGIAIVFVGVAIHVMLMLQRLRNSDGKARKRIRD
jgi:hypothetical protein